MKGLIHGNSLACNMMFLFLFFFFSQLDRDNLSSERNNCVLASCSCVHRPPTSLTWCSVESGVAWEFEEEALGNCPMVMGEDTVLQRLWHG